MLTRTLCRPGSAPVHWPYLRTPHITTKVLPTCIPLAAVNFLYSSSALLTNATCQVHTHEEDTEELASTTHLVVCSRQCTAQLSQAGREEPTGCLRPTVPDRSGEWW